MTEKTTTGNNAFIPIPVTQMGGKVAFSLQDNSGLDMCLVHHSNDCPMVKWARNVLKTSPSLCKELVPLGRKQTSQAESVHLR